MIRISEFFDEQPNPTIDPKTHAVHDGSSRILDAESDAAVEAQLQSNRARHYDPTTGRWASHEPLGFEVGNAELYRYEEELVRESGETPWRGRYEWTGREYDAEIDLQLNRVRCCGESAPGVWLGDDNRIVNAVEKADDVDADASITIGVTQVGDDSAIDWEVQYDVNGNRISPI